MESYCTTLQGTVQTMLRKTQHAYLNWHHCSHNHPWGDCRNHIRQRVMDEDDVSHTEARLAHNQQHIYHSFPSSPQSMLCYICVCDLQADPSHPGCVLVPRQVCYESRTPIYSCLLRPGNSCYSFRIMAAADFHAPCTVSQTL